MTVVVPLVDVTLRGMLGRRRTVLLVLLAGLPVLVALLIRVSGGRPDADRVLDTLVVRFVMALVNSSFAFRAVSVRPRAQCSMRSSMSIRRARSSSKLAWSS